MTNKDGSSYKLKISIPGNASNFRFSKLGPVRAGLSVGLANLGLLEKKP